MQTRQSASIRDDWGSVLFVDLRNFTNLLEIYGTERIETVLDAVFIDFKSVVESYGGTVDKLIGDGMMAVFRDDQERDCEANAVLAAGEMLHQRLPELENQTGLNIEIGIGISSGELQRANVAGIDETIISRNVNIASRLQSLCKKFGIAIITDEATRENVDSLTQEYTFRMVPDQRIEGLYERIDVFELCLLEEYDLEYIERYNEAARNYRDGEFSEALEFFVSAFSGVERRRDQALLHHFASECFNQLDSSDSLFQNPDRYDQHSTTQRTQADYLLWRLQQFIKKRDLVPSRMLDVGCGSGALTVEIAEEYPAAELVGIDESAAQIRKARADHTHSRVQYETADIIEYGPTDPFDVIVSNSAMHWVQKQDKAYTNIYQHLNPGGILAVHQGAKGCYSELHNAAKKAYKELGFEEYFDDFQFPLTYYDKDEMKRLLETHGFDPLKVDQMESEQPGTLVDDFAEASLLSYRKRLANKAEKQAFVERYTSIANEYDEIDTTRIYAFAVRPSE